MECNGEGCDVTICFSVRRAWSFTDIDLPGASSDISPRRPARLDEIIPPHARVRKAHLIDSSVVALDTCRSGAGDFESTESRFECTRWSRIDYASIRHRGGVCVLSGSRVTEGSLSPHASVHKLRLSESRSLATPGWLIADILAVNAYLTCSTKHKRETSRWILQHSEQATTRVPRFLSAPPMPSTGAS